MSTNCFSGELTPSDDLPDIFISGQYIMCPFAEKMHLSYTLYLTKRLEEKITETSPVIWL